MPYRLEGPGLAVKLILAACALNASVTALYVLAYRLEPNVSPLAGIWIRVIANLGLILMSFVRDGRPRPRLLAPRQGIALWLWGILGVLTVICFYLSVLKIGAGMATFLNTGSGIFVLGLSPLIIGHAVQRHEWIGALGAALGLSLLGIPALRGSSGDAAAGLLFGLLSGLFAALAYLAVARSGRSYPTTTVMLHWTVANLTVMAVVTMVLPLQWPGTTSMWSVLVVAGSGAALSQYLTAKAYQFGPAPLVACWSYAGPILSMSVDICFFQLRLTPLGWLGMLITILCGLILPLAQLRAATYSTPR